MVWQVLGSGKPAPSHCVNSIPPEKGFLEEGERSEGEDDEGEGEEKGDKATPTHSHIPVCCCFGCHGGCLDASKMAPWWPATFGLLGTEAALSFLSPSG